MGSNDGEPTAGRRHYTLACAECGMQLEDDGLILECPADHTSALLRTQYADRQFSPCPDQVGMFRYQQWLPVIRTQDNAGRAVVYHSERLAKVLGLQNLWIAFNGYWPERDAILDTATFKELEAYTVLGRLPERQIMLTVASSGNTGAAFAWACSRGRVPCLVIIPRRGFGRFEFRAPLRPYVNLAVIEDGDYQDAISLASEVCRIAPFQAEGGVKNVGRRDGLATVLLSAFEEMRCLPSYYFQAAGSGTGAIAVLEAAKRLQATLSNTMLPRLMLCQNQPFTPIYDAWRMNKRCTGDESADHLQEAVKRVYADELTNRTPPYEIRGGVHDSLVESRGDVLIADNESVRIAINMFLELEGIDIEPAAGVALACLRDAVNKGRIERESVVLLNITGGGRRRFRRDHSLIPAEPQLQLTRESLTTAEAMHRVTALTRTLEAIES